MHKYDFVEVDIGYRMAILRILYIMTLTYFRGHTISGNRIFNLWKTMKASEKCSSTTIIVVEIRHRMAPLRMLYIVILSYIFKVNKFLKIIYNIWKTVRASEQFSSTTFIEVDIRYQIA